MPTYDYQCESCQYKFEEVQSFSEPPLTKCPGCKKKKLVRLFGGGGLGFTIRGGHSAMDSAEQRLTDRLADGDIG
jgi:putative FmdB family regulatory protein